MGLESIRSMSEMEIFHQLSLGRLLTMQVGQASASLLPWVQPLIYLQDVGFTVASVFSPAKWKGSVPAMKH
jgi:hypothetical protein